MAGINQKNIRITTTIAKAKALKKFVEPLITKSKDDTTNSRRVVRAGQQLVGGYIIFAYPLKACFRVKAKGYGLSLRRKGRFVVNDNAHIRLTLYAPNKKHAPGGCAEVNRT